MQSARRARFSALAFSIQDAFCTFLSLYCTSVTRRLDTVVRGGTATKESWVDPNFAGRLALQLQSASIPPVDEVFVLHVEGMGSHTIGIVPFSGSGTAKRL